MMAQRSSRPPRKPTPSRGPRSALVLAAPLFMLYGLVVAAALLPGDRLWGLNSLGFHAPPMRIAGLVVIGLSFLPPVSRMIYRGASSGLARLSTLRGGLLAAATGVLSILVLFTFRSSTLLLGDGQLVVTNLQSRLQQTAGFPAIVASILKTDFVSPGSSAAYYAFARTIDGLAHTNPATAVALLNSILGGVFVGLVTAIALRTAAPPPIRIWLVVLTLFSGAVELFFGYVENYTGLILFGAVYVIVAVRCVHNKGSVWLAVAALAIAIFLHVEAVLLLPSLALLLALRIPAARVERTSRLITGGLIALVVIGTFVAGALTPLRRFFLPFIAHGSSYGVLSASHALDVVDELLLVAPSLPLILAMAVTVLVRRSQDAPRSAPKSTRSSAAKTWWLVTEVEWHFTFLIVIPVLLYLVFLRPEIGMSRDWDLFTIVLLGIAPLSLLILNRLLRTPHGPALVAQTTAPALVLSAVLTVAWIGVHANPERTTAWLTQTLEHDPSGAPYIYENLSLYYSNRNRPNDAVAAMEKAVAVSGNPRYMLNLALLYKDTGNSAGADALLRRILDTNPDFPRVREILVMSLYGEHNFRDAIKVADAGIGLDPNNPFYHYYVGKCLIVMGKTEDGAEALRDARRLSPPTSMLQDIDAILKTVEAK